MAQTTVNYGLYKPEATDTYNHLVYDNPNMDTIDATMKNNSDHGVDSATCIKSGTVHSVTRTNTSCPVFKFTATGDWNTGDTMNVDGTPVSVFLPDGTAPLTGCFVINTEVLAIISGSRVTLMCPVIPDSSDIPYDNTTSGLTATNVQTAIDEVDANIDALSGTPTWTSINIGSGNNLRYRKSLNIVELFYWTDQNYTTTTILTSLPSDIRPASLGYPNRIVIPDGYQSKDTLVIAENGDLTLTINNPGANWRLFHVMYFV